MRQITIRFEPGDTVYGVRQLCLLCNSGEVKVRSVTNPAEEWWVKCPVCYGQGTHPQGCWVVEKFQVHEISWRHGFWVGSPELQYEQCYGDYDIRCYPDELIFETQEEAEQEADKRIRTPQV